jgi:uncharacterized membrane protein YoaK (UPF0700 family)
VSIPRVQPGAPRRRLALLLGGSAGYLDAVGYLTLRLFTANMTGNTVLLGIALGEGRWWETVRTALAIAAFFLGAAAGGLLMRGRRIGTVFGTEAVLLLAGMASWAVLRPSGGAVAGTAAFPLIVCLSAAMGAQSSAVRRVGEQRVSTTYITGTLISLAVDAMAEVLIRQKKRPGVAATAVPPTHGTPSLLLGIWTTYVVGALVGGFSQQHWGFWAVALPVVVLGTLAAWELAAPRSSA